MVTINPLEVILWTFRRNEKDVINLYDSLSPVMQVATGGLMLNFGFWDEINHEPLSAQKNMCNFFGKFAELESAKIILDVGSGLGAPAVYWSNFYPNVYLKCVNINFNQLKFSDSGEKIEFINSTSTKLPFSDNSVDRVLALESSQHFKPFEDFISESRRVLKKSGVLALALPVTISNSTLKGLGILKFTWSSEHYSLDFIKKTVIDKGFTIKDELLIGSMVYDPLCNYYVNNRKILKKSIEQKYSGFVEKILCKSLLKMKKASEEKIIDYLLLKCKL